MTKKTYVAPTLAVYGAVSEITRLSGLVNADTPGGTPNTAYSPGS